MRLACILAPLGLNSSCKLHRLHSCCTGPACYLHWACILAALWPCILVFILTSPVTQYASQWQALCSVIAGPMQPYRSTGLPMNGFVQPYANPICPMRCDAQQNAGSVQQCVGSGPVENMMALCSDTFVLPLDCIGSCFMSPIARSIENHRFAHLR